MMKKVLATQSLRTILLVTLLILSATSDAQTFNSDNQRVNVLELYTSEGCSSCPPADRWLSKLKDDKRLWKQLIPLAFHVDYWDYIGWQDRFAKPNYSQRQRIYARQNSLSTVYTPGMLLNGEEWRSWFYLRQLSLEKSNPPGILQARLQDNHLKVEYIPNSTEHDGNMVLNIAILGFGLSSQVDAGENRGRKLKHDFVVLAHTMNKMRKQPNGYSLDKITLPKSEPQAKRKGIAVWINRENSLTPIQATGGWLD